MENHNVRRFAVLLSLAAMLMAGRPVRADNLVFDGGFEDPGVIPGQNNPPGWTFTHFVGTTSGVGAVPYSGSYAYIFSSGYGGVDFETGQLLQSDEITQTILTTPGQQYTLTFYLDQVLSRDLQGFWFSWNGTNQGPAVPVTCFGCPNVTGYMLYTFTLTGGPGTTSTLSFEGFSTHGGYYLDDVDLETAAASAPEPADLGLVAAALAFWIIRRRHNSIPRSQDLPLQLTTIRGESI